MQEIEAKFGKTVIDVLAEVTANWTFVTPAHQQAVLKLAQSGNMSTDAAMVVMADRLVGARLFKGLQSTWPIERSLGHAVWSMALCAALAPKVPPRLSRQCMVAIGDLLNKATLGMQPGETRLGLVMPVLNEPLYIGEAERETVLKEYWAFLEASDARKIQQAKSKKPKPHTFP